MSWQLPGEARIEAIGDVVCSVFRVFDMAFSFRLGHPVPSKILLKVVRSWMPFINKRSRALNHVARQKRKRSFQVVVGFDSIYIVCKVTWYF